MRDRDDCERYEALMADVLFGGGEAGARVRLEAHLATCPACAEAFREMEATLAVTALRERPAPPPGFMEGYADRLAARMAAEHRPSWQARWSDLRQRLTQYVLPVPRLAYQVALALVFVALGVFLGRMDMGTPPTEGDAVADGGYAVQTPVLPADLEVRARQYMDRSRVLLLGLVNFDAANEDPVMLNLPRRQEIARTLIEDADGLKSDLSDARQQRLRELVSDLEVILLQIANLEAEYDIPAIEMVRTSVDRKGVLLKINVEEMLLEAAPTPKAPTGDQTNT